MHISFLALAASVPAFVSAVNYTISVGKGGITFTPPTVTAAVGDFVNFQFEGGNHTVTQSTFADPCTQPFNPATNAAGFDSGFMPVDANASTLNVWPLEIKDTKPLWFFCARAGHCKGGMVGAINAPTTGNTFDAFKAKLATAETPAYGTTKPIPSSPPAPGATNAPNGTTPSNNGAYRLASGSASAVTVFGLLASILL